MSTNHACLSTLACGLLLLAGGTQGKPAVNSAAPGTGTGNITAAFNGLQGHNGYLRVSLFNANSFPNGTPLARRDIPLQALGAKASPLTITFDGLPPGAYAVCTFHDRSGSGKMTQDLLGIPTEEWGMSGNPRPRFRAPRFDEVRVDLKARETKTLSIALHN